MAGGRFARVRPTFTPARIMVLQLAGNPWPAHRSGPPCGAEQAATASPEPVRTALVHRWASNGIATTAANMNSIIVLSLGGGGFFSRLRGWLVDVCGLASRRAEAVGIPVRHERSPFFKGAAPPVSALH
jgi:S-formylglutathione hydrolase FrmB